MPMKKLMGARGEGIKIQNIYPWIVTEIQVAKEFGLTILERLITTGHSLARSHY